MKKEWLEQNENWLENSNRNSVDITLWKEAKGLSDLINLLNPCDKTNVSAIYGKLLKFNSKKADKSINGHKQKVLHNKTHREAR